MLKVKSVGYAYQKSFQLEDISFKLKTGNILGVIGESGCGKTTLLKLIFGKIDADEGEMFWHDDKILGPSRQLIAGKEDFKYVTQDFELMPYTSVLENIVKPLSRQHITDNNIRAKELLKVVNLEDQQDKKVKNLSGGQKQRVALAQALSKTPKLLLLDEPFSHIDSFFKNKLRRNLFNFIQKEKITCVIATHDKADVLPFADEIMVLKDGKKIDQRSPINIYNRPENPYVAGLFGDYNYVNKSFISKTLQMEHIVVYPNEIELQVSSINEVQIENYYHMGGYYKILLIYKEQKLIVHSFNAPKIKVSYTVKFKVEDILLRLQK